MLRSTVVTAGEDPVRVAVLGDGDYDDTRDVLLTNVSEVPVWVGAEDVTPDTGIPVAAGGGLAFDAVTKHNLPWVVTATGTAEVRVLEVGV